MILPIVNNNGTSRQELIQQRREVHRALEDVLAELRMMNPHGRDYQTDPTGEQYKLARAQHDRRVKTISDLKGEIMDEAVALSRGK